MQTLNLLLGVDVQASPDDGDGRLHQLVDAVLDPLLQRLAGPTAVRCGLHVSGPLLPWMASKAPDTLRALQQAVREERIEPIGGGYFDPILPAIPEHDATGQLRLMGNQLERQLGRKPVGVWLPGRTWSASLTTLLQRAGYGYTLIDESAFLATGIGQDELDGYRITERSGFALSLFPIHAAFQRQLAGLDLRPMADLLRGHLGSRKERTVVLAYDGVAGGERLETLLRLIDVARAQHHWIKTSTFGAFLERTPATGRTYPHSVARPAGLDDSLEGLGWERFLVEYPEVNDLHKRMLMTSYRVHRMRMAAQGRTRGAAAAVDAVRMRKLLERACTLLWSSQNHGVYWHGDRLGLYDAERRLRAMTRLMEVDRLADQALGADPARVQSRSLDYDCDGYPELLLRSGLLGAVLAPQEGGALVSLDLLERDLPLGPVVSRRQEAYHVTSGQNEIQLVDEDEDSVDLVASAESTAELDSVMWFDDHPRLSFLDHFLGPETHLQNWYRGCYMEAGDFVTAPYEIITQQEPTGDDEMSVLLGRSGTVDVGGQQSLVRIEKRFVFSRTLPRLRVEYRLINRYFEPVRTHFGVEINLLLPGGISGRSRFKAVCGEEDLTGDLAEVRELQGVGYLELLDEASDLVVCVYVEEPTDLWTMPVETVNRVDGNLQRVHQGVSLLFHRSTDLWGSEEQSLGLRLEFMSI